VGVQQRRAVHWLSIALLLGCGTLYYLSPVTQVTDSHYSLLVSEQIYRHGGVRLDDAFRPPIPADYPGVEKPGALPYHVLRHRGALYHSYPVGSSILSVPFVALFNAFGISAERPDHRYFAEGEIKMERAIAALICAAAVVVYFLIALEMLPLALAFALAACIALASPLWSTLSRGLWNQTWQQLLLAAAVLTLVRAPLTAARAALLSSLLAWASFTRPNSVIAYAAVLLSLFGQGRRPLAVFAGTAAAWIAGYVAWCQLTYHAWTRPSVHDLGWLSMRDQVQRLAGLLLSPARGLFIYCPSLLLLLVALVALHRFLPSPRLVRTALLALVGHLLLLLLFWDWWAGHCYGPRHWCDALPWFFLLAVQVLAAWRRAPKPRPRVLAVVALGLLSWWGALVHGIGAWSQRANDWNVGLEDGGVPGRLWDWQRAPFLVVVLPAKDFPPYPPLPLGTRVLLDEPQSAVYLQRGWSQSAGALRWTDGEIAELAFSLVELQPITLSFAARPFLVEDRLPFQRVEVIVNGALVARFVLDREPLSVQRVRVPPRFVDRQTVVRFRLPDAASPSSFGSNGDRRRIAIAVEWLEVSPSEPRPQP
jgi:hypothetical protein